MNLDEMEKKIDELSLDELLDAFERAFTFARDFHEINYWKQRRCQATAFRARILRMDAEKDKRIDVLRAEHDYLMDGAKELKAELDEKDKRIAELEAYIDAHNRRILQEDIDALMEI